MCKNASENLAKRRDERNYECTYASSCVQFWDFLKIVCILSVVLQQVEWSKNYNVVENNLRLSIALGCWLYVVICLLKSSQVLFVGDPNAATDGVIFLLFIHSCRFLAAHLAACRDQTRWVMCMSWKIYCKGKSVARPLGNECDSCDKVEKLIFYFCSGRIIVHWKSEDCIFTEHLCLIWNFKDFLKMVSVVTTKLHRTSSLFSLFSFIYFCFVFVHNIIINMLPKIISVDATTHTWCSLRPWPT